jgi:hypothetical protein
MKIGDVVLGLIGLGVFHLNGNTENKLPNSPKIALKPDTLFFETQESRDSIWVLNSGNSTLFLDSIRATKGYGWCFEMQYKNNIFGQCFFIYEPFVYDSSRYKIAPNDSAMLVFISPDLCPVCKSTATFSFFEDTLYFYSNDSANNPVPLFARGEGRPSEVSEKSYTLPINFSLLQNYPNPFFARNKTATDGAVTFINFDLPKAQMVDISVYNLLGEKVITLANGTMPAGKNQLTWNGMTKSGEYLPSGIYVYALVADQVRISKKLLLLH